MRKLTSRTAFTVVTAALCVVFLAPFLYALVAAFDASSTGSATRGAPIYPAIARTYQCTDSQLCTYQPVSLNRATGKTVANGSPVDVSQQADPTLPVYVVPGRGNLALLDDLSGYGQPSVFIDPAANKQVDVSVNTSTLSRVWDFSISLDNFTTAINWAGVFTPIGPGGMATWLLNSVIVSGLSTIGAVLSCVLVAYGFARFRFPGRDVLFLILIGSVLIPYQVTLIPQFILYHTLGLTSSFLPLTLPNFFGNAPAGSDPRSTMAVSPIYFESLKTYEQFAGGDSLFQKAVDQFQLRSSMAGRPIEAVKKRVLRVGVVRNTRILEISATLPDARQAQALAKYMAESTVELSRALVNEGDQDLLRSIGEQDREIRAKLRQTRAQRRLALGNLWPTINASSSETTTFVRSKPAWASLSCFTSVETRSETSMGCTFMTSAAPRSL